MTSMLGEWQWPIKPNIPPVPAEGKPKEKAEEIKPEDTKIVKNEVENSDVVDLSNLKVDFLNDQEIAEYYKTKLEEIEDINKWLEKNQFDIKNNRDKITLAV